jgi:Tol biopolymer transport system component
LTLAAGTRLGRYEIVAPLGAGGMGEVYRAQDPRLGREVAIKVLPAEVAGDEERLRRFEREARAASALAHPNLLTVFELGESDGVAFLVSELLAGDSLRARLDAGALPPKKAIDVALQIARGLGAAHARGIVHRDLKPENLFLTRDGIVKILDFGLAKLVLSEAATTSGFHAAATAAELTREGTVVGTVGYMSPEQVRGEPVDARSDLFAFGCVLYELLAGRRAFAGGSPVETLSAILRDEPPPLALAAGELAAPALAAIVAHCLEKDPAARFQSAKDLVFALEQAAAPSPASSPRLPAVGAPARSGAAIRLASAALAGAALGALALALATRGAAPPARRAAERAHFRQLTRQPGAESAPALSPDGASVVYAKRDGGDLDLFFQRADGRTALPLTADCERDDTAPAFSPDGSRIAYRSECGGGGIFVMGATGESARRVADFGQDPAWSPDGRELAVATEPLGLATGRQSRSQLWAIAVESGSRRLLSEHDAMQPAWSPSGRRVAFWGIFGETTERDLWTVAADGSESAAERALAVTRDVEVDWNPNWAPGGSTLYFASSRGGTFNLWRVPIDEASGAVRGPLEPLGAPTSYVQRFALASGGRHLAYVDRRVVTTLFLAPLDLARRRLGAPPRSVLRGSFEISSQALSPDGDRIAFANADHPQKVHLVRSDGSGYRQLTDGPERDRLPAWTPDGRRIVFQTTRAPTCLASIGADGSGLELAPPLALCVRGVAAPDGRRLSLTRAGRPTLLFDLAPGLARVSWREFPEIEPGVVFWPDSWSPDGDLQLGVGIRGWDAEGLFLYSHAEQRYRRVPFAEPITLDTTARLVARDFLVHGGGTRLWLRSVGSGEGAVLAEAPGERILVDPTPTLDGRLLSWLERADESDLWLMTLDEPASQAGAAAGGGP